MTEKPHFRDILEIGMKAAEEAFKAGTKSKNDAGYIDLSSKTDKGYDRIDEEKMHIARHAMKHSEGEIMDYDGFPHIGAIIARWCIIRALEKDIEEGR